MSGEGAMQKIKDFHLQIGSRKSQNLALTVQEVPSLLVSGNPTPEQVQSGRSHECAVADDT